MRVTGQAKFRFRRAWSWVMRSRSIGRIGFALDWIAHGGASVEITGGHSCSEATVMLQIGAHNGPIVTIFGKRSATKTVAFLDTSRVLRRCHHT